MRLMCDGIFNDQFITQSLPSPRVKKLKIGQHLPKLWVIKEGSFFYETLYTCRYCQLAE